ncbi:NAD(+)/NADH kinase, partial [Streptomyces tricolor]
MALGRSRPGGGSADMTVNRVGLVVHGGRAEAVAAARAVRAWCAEHAVGCADID